jgi:hypothetical protein
MWDNELDIKESIEIIDHVNYYDIKFQYPNGYIDTDYYINKDLYNSIPRVNQGSWINILYVSGSKYYKNPEHWIKLVKTWREPNDCRKWLKSI